MKSSESDVDFLRKRHSQLSVIEAFSSMQLSMDREEIADWILENQIGCSWDMTNCIANTNITIGKNLNILGNTIINQNLNVLKNIISSGRIIVTNTTDATNTNDGSLQTIGIERAASNW